MAQAEVTIKALDLMAYELTGRATNVIAINLQRAEAQALFEQQSQQAAPSSSWPATGRLRAA